MAGDEHHTKYCCHDTKSVLQCTWTQLSNMIRMKRQNTHTHKRSQKCVIFSQFGTSLLQHTTPFSPPIDPQPIKTTIMWVTSVKKKVIPSSLAGNSDHARWRSQILLVAPLAKPLVMQGPWTVNGEPTVTEVAYWDFTRKTMGRSWNMKPTQTMHHYYGQITRKLPYTLPETNIVPENGWLEYYIVSFWGLPIFRGFCC